MRNAVYLKGLLAFSKTNLEASHPMPIYANADCPIPLCMRYLTNAMKTKCVAQSARQVGMFKVKTPRTTKEIMHGNSCQKSQRNFFL